MKQFLINFLKFLLVLGFVALTVSGILLSFLNPYFGNVSYNIKYNYFIRNKDKFNFIYIGSSRVGRQINPEVIDSILYKYDIHSFNMGVGAIYNPELYYLYERILNDTTVHLKYSFIELQDLNRISNANLQTKQNYYWLNLKYLKFVFSYVLNSGISFPEKVDLLYTYSYSLFLKYTSLKMIGNQEVDEKSRKKTSVIGKKKNGFYSIAEKLNDVGPKFQQEAHTNFLADTAIILNRKKNAYTITNESYGNSSHALLIEKLLKDSEKRGIHLIFLILPRLISYPELLALKKYIPENNIIDLSNPNIYPELYLAKNNFDRGHLNDIGANILSAYIGVQTENILSGANRK